MLLLTCSPCCLRKRGPRPPSASRLKERCYSRRRGQDVRACARTRQMLAAIRSISSLLVLLIFVRRGHFVGRRIERLFVRQIRFRDLSFDRFGINRQVHVGSRRYYVRPQIATGFLQNQFVNAHRVGFGERHGIGGIFSANGLFRRERRAVFDGFVVPGRRHFIVRLDFRGRRILIEFGGSSVLLKFCFGGFRCTSLGSFSLFGRLTAIANLNDRARSFEHLLGFIQTDVKKFDEVVNRRARQTIDVSHTVFSQRVGLLRGDAF